MKEPGRREEVCLEGRTGTQEEGGGVHGEEDRELGLWGREEVCIGGEEEEVEGTGEGGKHRARTGRREGPQPGKDK